MKWRLPVQKMVEKQKSSLVWGGSCFLDKGGKGNRIFLWVKSWGLLWECIDRGWNTEKKGSTYQILLTHTHTHTHTHSLLVRTVYAYTLTGILAYKLFPPSQHYTHTRARTHTQARNHTALEPDTLLFISVKLIRQNIYSLDPHSETDIFCHRLHFHKHN